MFMPPPTDEQAAMQQKMIKYMMVFMGFMFFKVASGLCIYFIASSLWGIAERKLLPKTLKPKTDVAEQPAPARPAPAASSSGNGAATRSRRKQRGRK
jgi:YidC/Oxa1 family membrane protein insertase